MASSGNVPIIVGKYLRWRPLFTQALLSSFVVTYYTLDSTFIQSIFNPAHLLTWLMSFLLMFILAALCAVISTELDRRIPYHENSFKRVFWQIIFGVFLVSVIALYVVYAAYDLFWDIDLWQTDYYSRDFVVIAASILMINSYHFHLYRQRHFDQALMQENPETGVEYESLYAELRTVFEVVDDTEPIMASRIGAFFLKENKSHRKEVQLILRDGSQRSMGWSSLNQVRQQCPDLFILANRHCLVNRLYIKGVCRPPDERFGSVILDIPQCDPIPLSRRAYEELIKMQVEVLN